jgi:hypothetical protein
MKTLALHNAPGEGGGLAFYGLFLFCVTNTTADKSLLLRGDVMGLEKNSTKSGLWLENPNQTKSNCSATT